MRNMTDCRGGGCQGMGMLVGLGATQTMRCRAAPCGRAGTCVGDLPQPASSTEPGKRKPGGDLFAVRSPPNPPTVRQPFAGPFVVWDALWGTWSIEPKIHPSRSHTPCVLLRGPGTGQRVRYHARAVPLFEWVDAEGLQGRRPCSVRPGGAPCSAGADQAPPHPAPFAVPEGGDGLTNDFSACLREGMNVRG